MRKRRRSSEPIATSRVCPECHVAGPQRLRPDQVCAACEAQRAWSRVGGDAPLVIDHAAVDAAVRRRQGEAAGEPWWKRALVLAPPAATLAAGALAGWLTVRLLSARALEPLGTLLDDLTRASWQATLAGLLALVLGVAALVRLRRQRHFRRLLLVTSHLCAVVVGSIALVTGAFHWVGFHGAFGGQYTSMPPRDPVVVPGPMQRILDATVVVLAPGQDGDARDLVLGTGAVIAREPGRAWIVTCSHVAMPYAAVGTWRHARDAQPVWVQLSDGRQGRARVRWIARPPLDVALVELPIDHAPAPVPIAPDASAMQGHAEVAFVPNPYRSGWKLLQGHLLRRETHRTPAGSYDLLYTDLPVTHGDSGSGLFDERGELVGLNTWAILGEGPSQGISLPSETMRALVDAIQHGTLEQLDGRDSRPAGSAAARRRGVVDTRK